jgi:hypothetical protein
MNCREIMNKMYEYEGDESAPLFGRFWVWLLCHLCPRCAEEFERYRKAREALTDGLFVFDAENFGYLEDAIMARVLGKREESPEFAGEMPEGEAGISFRAWIITGVAVFLSFTCLFFSLDFARIAASGDLSFLLPMGITIGLVLSVYGAIFIGSHLKELSEKFGLR